MSQAQAVLLRALVDDYGLLRERLARRLGSADDAEEVLQQTATISWTKFDEFQSGTDFVRWALTDGQAEAASLDYAPLPSSLIPKLTARLDSIVAAGAAAK